MMKKILVLGSNSKIIKKLKLKSKIGHNYEFNYFNTNSYNFENNLKIDRLIKNSNIILNFHGSYSKNKERLKLKNIHYIKKLVEKINVLNKNVSFIHVSTFGVTDYLGINKDKSLIGYNYYEYSKIISENILTDYSKFKFTIIRPAGIFYKNSKIYSNIIKIKRLKFLFYFDKSLYIYITKLQELEKILIKNIKYPSIKKKLVKNVLNSCELLDISSSEKFNQVQIKLPSLIKIIFIIIIKLNIFLNYKLDSKLLTFLILTLSKKINY